jgi:hypothetical protein
MERKELESMKSAPSQPGLDFFVRNSAWAFHCCGAFPQPLDDTQFEFVGRAREKTPHVKKLLIPDCIEKSGLVYKEKEDTDQRHCDHWGNEINRSVRT